VYVFGLEPNIPAFQPISFRFLNGLNIFVNFHAYNNQCSVKLGRVMKEHDLPKYILSQPIVLFVILNLVNP
jgi:hypothetical protein